MEIRDSEAVDPEIQDGSWAKPLSVPAHCWDQVLEFHTSLATRGGGFLEELSERAGFMILRGLQPEDAVHDALNSMNRELDALAANANETLWWVVREVAALFPLPRRGTDGGYVRRILELAQRVEENARYDGGLGSGYMRDHPPVERLGPEGLEKVEATTRRRAEQIRADIRSVPGEEELAEMMETGDYQ
jgi:hypothetical protein